MAKIEFKGLAEYTAKLNRLFALSRDKIIGAAIYDGAAVVADAVRAELDALPTDNRHKNKRIGPTEEEKESLKESLGVTPLQDDKGFLNVKVGFDGYHGKPTPTYPRGRPNQMIARAVQRGTSFMYPNPFVKKAVAKCRRPAQAAIEKRVNEKIEKIMK